ncbi:HCE1 enzyme, partial [Amia calva]|nr:HCE1 enzyme [Amia calva]
CLPVSYCFPAQDPDGPLVLFGDIAMDLGFGNADPCTSRNCKWKKGSDGRVHVPYVISSAYSAREHSIIESALQSFFYSTCIQFERRNQHEDYLSIESRSGCYSFVGRRGGRQVVSLQRGGCVFHHVVQHEVIHALGFNHEQTRSDRDQHVRILYENIIRGQEHNFNKINTNNLGTPYDYGSVMHYSRFAFSGNGRATIEPIPDPNVSIGRAREMSPIDIARINRLYECSKGLILNSNSNTNSK